MNVPEKLNDAVLVLNKNWQAVGVTSVEIAMCGLFRGVATGMDVDGPNELRPVNLAEWLALPIRPQDKALATVRGPVRVPTVIVAINYTKVPKKRPRLDNRGIRERDHGRCQVTGEYCPENGSVDHLTPKSRQGPKKSWKNLAWMRKDLNHLKGNRTLAEMGWTLIRQPKEPPELPVNLLIHRRPDKPDWDHFLIT